MTAWLAIMALLFLVVGILFGIPYVIFVAIAAFLWPELWVAVDALREWRRRSRR